MKVPYNLEKISIAISGAFNELNKEFDDSVLLDDIEWTIWNLHKEEISVEEIQDIVEECLIDNGYIDEARSYIRYRYDHELARKQKTEQAIAEKLFAANVQNQNANIDEYSFGGRKGEADNVIMKQYALDYCMSKMSKENHLNNEIYIHKLNCA